MANESPLSKDISNWWSDCYGEAPRMFYHALAAVPDWAPAGENHILYSKDLLKEVSYQPQTVQYTATDNTGVEHLRLAFQPARISLDGKEILKGPDLNKQAYTISALPGGDYAVNIKRMAAGKVIITGKVN
jgi:hypothetical protein